MKKIASILAAILVLSSCSAYRSLFDSNTTTGTEYYNTTYRGQTHSQIVREFGAPDREVSDGADGYILVYEKVSTTSRVDSMGYVDHDVNVSYVQFFFDGSGICYNVKTNRLSPTQEKSLVKAYTAEFGIISGATILGSLVMLIAMLAH